MDGLRLEGVTVAYDGVPALRDADLVLPRGEVLAVLGPSGSGKSTLLRAVAGLEPLAAGSVRFDGADLAGVPVHRRGFALMFQDGQLFAHLTVARNVAYPLRLRRTGRAAAAARVAGLLELVGLGGYADRLPGTLSGGERQRVALARALACEPRLLLLDEPLSALDRGLRERLAGDLRRILVEAGTTALMVTHDVDEAYAVADRVALVRAARVVQAGPVADVDAHPVDAGAARQLGYGHLLAGDEVRTLLPDRDVQVGPDGPDGPDGPAAPDGPDRADDLHAVRREAWCLVPAGGAAAEVVRTRRTAAGPRLVVAVEGVGEVELAGPALPTGERVRVGLDPAGVVPVGAGPQRPLH